MAVAAARAPLRPSAGPRELQVCTRKTMFFFSKMRSCFRPPRGTLNQPKIFVVLRFSPCVSFCLRYSPFVSCCLHTSYCVCLCMLCYGCRCVLLCGSEYRWSSMIVCVCHTLNLFCVYTCRSSFGLLCLWGGLTYPMSPKISVFLCFSPCASFCLRYSPFVSCCLHVS